ncbi:13661_t:CDS:2 [Entrophospora sp. SA101]|nr:13661_t:CDS:2 [Entrophospora sp. SA101]
MRFCNPHVSPFNITEKYQNPDLPFKQVKTSFEEFMSDRGIVIDPLVITGVYALTNGHTGFTCLCGCAIDENLPSKTLMKDDMINKLKELHSMEAVKFLCQYLLDGVKSTEVPDQHNHLIKFLEAEVDSSLNMIRLSSSLVGTYIKTDVLPESFPHAHQSDKYQKLDILKMLQKATEPINVALNISWSDGSYVRHYIDIVIDNNEENIVLELVATANQSNLEEHFNCALSYGDVKVAAIILSESHYTDNPNVDMVGEIMRVYCDQEKWSNFCKLYPTEPARRNLVLNTYQYYPYYKQSSVHGSVRNKAKRDIFISLIKLNLEEKKGYEEDRMSLVRYDYFNLSHLSLDEH